MTHHPIHLLIGTQLSQIVNHLEDQSLSRLKPTLYRDEVRGWFAKLAANDPEALTQTTLTDLLFAARWAVLSELDMRCHVPPNSDDEPIVTMEAPGTVIPLRQLQKICPEGSDKGLWRSRRDSGRG